MSTAVALAVGGRHSLPAAVRPPASAPSAAASAGAAARFATTRAGAARGAALFSHSREGKEPIINRNTEPRRAGKHDHRNERTDDHVLEKVLPSTIPMPS